MHEEGPSRRHRAMSLRQLDSWFPSSEERCGPQAHMCQSMQEAVTESWGAMASSRRNRPRPGRAHQRVRRRALSSVLTPSHRGEPDGRGHLSLPQPCSTASGFCPGHSLPGGGSQATCLCPHLSPAARLRTAGLPGDYAGSPRVFRVGTRKGGHYST